MAEVGTRVYLDGRAGTIAALSCAGDARIVFDDGAIRWVLRSDLPTRLQPVKSEPAPEWLRKAVWESFADNICGGSLERADSYKKIIREYK